MSDITANITTPDVINVQVTVGAKGDQGSPGIDGSPDTPNEVAAKLGNADDATALGAVRTALGLSQVAFISWAGRESAADAIKTAFEFGEPVSLAKSNGHNKGLVYDLTELLAAVVEVYGAGTTIDSETFAITPANGSQDNCVVNLPRSVTAYMAEGPSNQFINYVSVTPDAGYDHAWTATVISSTVKIQVKDPNNTLSPATPVNGVGPVVKPGKPRVEWEWSLVSVPKSDNGIDYGYRMLFSFADIDRVDLVFGEIDVERLEHLVLSGPLKESIDAGFSTPTQLAGQTFPTQSPGLFGFSTAGINHNSTLRFYGSKNSSSDAIGSGYRIELGQKFRFYAESIRNGDNTGYDTINTHAFIYLSKPVNCRAVGDTIVSGVLRDPPSGINYRYLTQLELSAARLSEADRLPPDYSNSQSCFGPVYGDSLSSNDPNTTFDWPQILAARGDYSLYVPTTGVPTGDLQAVPGWKGIGDIWYDLDFPSSPFYTSIAAANCVLGPAIIACLVNDILNEHTLYDSGGGQPLPTLYHYFDVETDEWNLSRVMLANMVLECRRRSKTAIVLTCPPIKSYLNANATKQANRQSLNDWIVNELSNVPGVVIGRLDQWLDSDGDDRLDLPLSGPTIVDFLHPNTQGQELIADFVESIFNGAS